LTEHGVFALKPAILSHERTLLKELTADAPPERTDCARADQIGNAVNGTGNLREPEKCLVLVHKFFQSALPEKSRDVTALLQDII
jgi:hypothetical protein